MIFSLLLRHIGNQPVPLQDYKRHVGGKTLEFQSHLGKEEEMGLNGILNLIVVFADTG